MEANSKTVRVPGWFSVLCGITHVVVVVSATVVGNVGAVHGTRESTAESSAALKPVSAMAERVHDTEKTASFGAAIDCKNWFS